MAPALHRAPAGLWKPSSLPTQSMPVASIWHVGAHAAPNLSSDDWLQDWKVLGSVQVSAGKRNTGQVDWGTPGGIGSYGMASWPAPSIHLPKNISACRGQLRRPLMQ